MANTKKPLGQLRPIAEAPIKPGEVFGPCLLTPGRNRRWTIGEHDGTNWHDLDNGPLDPTHYLLLPSDEDE